MAENNSLQHLVEPFRIATDEIPGAPFGLHLHRRLEAKDMLPIRLSPAGSWNYWRPRKLGQHRKALEGVGLMSENSEGIPYFFTVN